MSSRPAGAPVPERRRPRARVRTQTSPSESRGNLVTSGSSSTHPADGPAPSFHTVHPQETGHGVAEAGSHHFRFSPTLTAFLFPEELEVRCDLLKKAPACSLGEHFPTLEGGSIGCCEWAQRGPSPFTASGPHLQVRTPRFGEERDLPCLHCLPSRMTPILDPKF